MRDKSLEKGISIVKSLAISFVITLILVLIVSILLTYTSLKESTIPLLNTIMMIIGITVGSIYMAVKVEGNGWLYGGLIGASYFIVLLLLNYLFIKPFTLDIYSISKFFIALITGIIAGIIGINIK